MFAEWILVYRHDALTAFFLWMPLLLHPIFFMITITLGYWLRPERLSLRMLFFLVPMATLSNTVLKQFFAIPRPPQALHLISVSSYGFPSGDVQVATVFWLTLMSISQSSWRDVLCLPIGVVAFSRVYLGVHSVLDVVAGFLVGLVLHLVAQRCWKNWLFQGSWRLCCQFCLLLGVGLFLAQQWHLFGSVWSQDTWLAVGGLLGFFLCLPVLRDAKQHPLSLPTVVLSGALLLAYALILLSLLPEARLMPMLLLMLMAIVLPRCFFYGLITAAILKALLNDSTTVQNLAD